VNRPGIDFESGRRPQKVEEWHAEYDKYKPNCLRLELVKVNPGDLVAKYDLAWAYHSLGIAFQGKGDLAAAGKRRQ
jgi:hypothetical protein